MLIKFSCPKCGIHIEVDSQQAGCRGQCPQCRTVFVVPEARLGPGVTVGGFTIRRLIGSGGMANVYLARQNSLDRDVALKILSSQLSHDEADRARFLGEMRHLARLAHPNIVTAHDAGEDAGILYLAMDYMAGDSMEKRVRDSGPCSEAEALKIARKVAEALSYAWERHRLLHLDVKPANILTDANGEIKLADFGLARRLTPGQRSAVEEDIFGSPNYMSPEQAKGVEPLDCRSDIFSLGATLYNLVTGQVPFESPSVDEIFRKLEKESLPDPRQRVPSISRDMVLLIERMMARDRKRRYGAWADVLDDLQRLQRKRSLKKGPLPAGESVLKRNDRLPRRTGSEGTSPGVRPPMPTAPARSRPEGSDGSRLVFLIAGGVAILLIIVLMLYMKAAETPGPVTPPPRIIRAPAPPPVAPATTTLGPAPGRETELSAMFGAAVRYARENPQDYAGAISRYDAVCKAGTDTEYGRQALLARRRLEAIVLQAVNEAMSKLRTQIQPYEQQGRWPEAAAIVRNYSGPLQAESAASRANLAADLDRKAQQARDRALGEARLNLAAAIEGLAADAVAGNVTSAVARIVAVDKEPALSSAVAEWQALRGKVVKALAAPRTVMETFRPQIGKDIPVLLKRGRVTVRIDAVEGTTVRASRLVDTGQPGATALVAGDFTFDDLTLREKIARAGAGETEEEKIARGLVHCSEQDFAGALPLFDGVDNDFGRALSRQAATLKQAQDESAAARQKAAAETAAEDAYRKLMTTVFPMLGSRIEDSDAIARLESVRFTANHAKAVRSVIEAFREQFAGTASASTHRELLDALEDAVSAEGGTAGRRGGIDFTSPEVTVDARGSVARRMADGFTLLPEAGYCTVRVTFSNITFKGNYKIRWRLDADPADVDSLRIACWPFRRHPQQQQATCSLVFENGAWGIRGDGPPGEAVQVRGYAFVNADPAPAGKPPRQKKTCDVCFEKADNRLFAGVDGVRLCDVAMDGERQAEAELQPLQLELGVAMKGQSKVPIRCTLVEYSASRGAAPAPPAEPRAVRTPLPLR